MLSTSVTVCHSAVWGIKFNNCCAGEFDWPVFTGACSSSAGEDLVKLETPNFKGSLEDCKESCVAHPLCSAIQWSPRVFGRLQHTGEPMPEMCTRMMGEAKANSAETSDSDSCYIKPVALKGPSACGSCKGMYARLLTHNVVSEEPPAADPVDNGGMLLTITLHQASTPLLLQTSCARVVCTLPMYYMYIVAYMHTVCFSCPLYILVSQYHRNRHHTNRYNRTIFLAIYSKYRIQQ